MRRLLARLRRHRARRAAARRVAWQLERLRAAGIEPLDDRQLRRLLDRHPDERGVA